MTASAKQRAAQAALDFIKDGMTVGLGTGSTAAAFITQLSEKVRGGLDITAIATSQASEDQARAGGIEIIMPDETTRIDVAIDGADEIDPEGQLIKGGGGAHQREKIIAAAASQFVVIADASKAVPQLGAFPLPIEIDPFSYGLTVAKVRQALEGLGYGPASLALRPTAEGDGFFISDGGSYILDARLERIADAPLLDRTLTMLPGVISTGLFINITNTAVIAGASGVDIRHYNK